MIKSWPTLEWYLPPESEKLPAFQHVGTRLRDDGMESGRRDGDAVWVAQHEQGCAGLAWEWAEVRPGIVMLTDPNSIVTNLQFVDSDGKPVLGLLRTIAINRLVHALPWQPAAQAALQLQQARSGLAAAAQSAQTSPPHSLSRPLLRDVSAPGPHAAAERAGRGGTRASDSEAGIGHLPALHQLRHAA